MTDRAIRRHNTRRVIARRLAELIRQGFRIDEWVMKRTRGHNRRDSDERRWLQRRTERREARGTPAPDVAPHRRKRVGNRRDKAERPWSVRMVWRHYGGTSRYRSTFRTESAARESAAARMSHGWYVGAIIERWDGKRWVRVDG